MEEEISSKEKVKQFGEGFSAFFAQFDSVDTDIYKIATLEILFEEIFKKFEK